MYQRDSYKKRDKKYIYKFIKAHPFATFVLKGERLLATHIPVLIEGNEDDFLLYAHIAYNSEQYQYLKDGAEALMIFQGAHGYVSSSWYKDTDISTWDYSAVHVNVTLKLQTNQELEESLEKLVAHFEKDQKNPVFYKDLPKKMLQDHLPLITGFWCEPVKIEAIAKLHQGFEKDDLKSVTKHLQESGDPVNLQLKKDIEKENKMS
ncbi:FMN-binding negative transcriptional regulator [Salegentibacter sp. F188]|uniref:FMN-binding negative transcriptional regulator n=1 Tax=Autumnicola patrickiae TaxID=3075591 RepID=A0ABU3E668_9FLAO|nr:FMN-binding negative transcriptional regulator [Salegentibacter sp. F188]MDT0691490.1 FMN-binding negative transcriptional regulator [Salegentibacter sp. F188]